MKKFSEIGMSVAIACALILGAVWAAAQPQTAPSAPVMVVNRSTNPVSVNKAIVPVRLFGQESLSPGRVFQRFSTFYTVPAGKRLVVEHISCAVTLQPPDSLTCGIEESINSIAHSTSPAYTVGSASQFVRAGQAVKVIFGPGETFNAVVDWDNPNMGQPFVFFALSAYLEEAH